MLSAVLSLVTQLSFWQLSTKLGRGWWCYIGFTPFRPPVRATSHVRSVVPRILVGSISYLCILSSNIRGCVVCKVSCKITWIIMGWQRVSQNEGILVVLVMTTSSVANDDNVASLTKHITWCLMIREKSGKFQTKQKSGKSQGICVLGQGKIEFREKSGNFQLGTNYVVKFRLKLENPLHHKDIQLWNLSYYTMLWNFK